MRLFPAAWVAGEGFALGRQHLLPRLDAECTGLLITGRKHGDILRQPRAVAQILAIAVRQHAVPDEQITRLAGNCLALIAGEIGAAGVAVGRLRFDPFREDIVEAGHTVKTALVGVGVGRGRAALQPVSSNTVRMMINGWEKRKRNIVGIVLDRVNG